MRHLTSCVTQVNIMNNYNVTAQGQKQSLWFEVMNKVRSNNHSGPAACHSWDNVCLQEHRPPDFRGHNVKGSLWSGCQETGICCELCGAHSRTLSIFRKSRSTFAGPLSEKLLTSLIVMSITFRPTESMLRFIPAWSGIALFSVQIHARWGACFSRGTYFIEQKPVRWQKCSKCEVWSV